MPDSRQGPPILEVSGLCVNYGQARAVQGIDLRVDPGECVALLGANGAGKSSTLLAISGVIPSSGEIRFEGTNIRGLAPHEIVRRGLIQVPEQRAIFPDLTVNENLSMAGYIRRPGPDLDADLDFVWHTLPKLYELRRRRAGSLSGGEQQMLVIGKAFLASPRLLLIDELSLGLAPLMVTKLFNVIASIHDRGVAILMVEQFAPLAIRMADRVFVLEKGRVACSGPADEFARDSSRLAATYLGGRSVTRSTAPRIGEPSAHEA